MTKRDKSQEIENARGLNTPASIVHCDSPETVFSEDAFSINDSSVTSIQESTCSIECESDNDSPDCVRNIILEQSHVLKHEFTDLESKMDNVFDKFLKELTKTCK